MLSYLCVGVRFCTGFEEKGPPRIPLAWGRVDGNKKQFWGIVRHFSNNFKKKLNMESICLPWHESLPGNHAQIMLLVMVVRYL